MLYGAVIGDVLGSTFEFNNWLKSPEELPIFPPDAHPTDDSVLTCAVADALIASALLNECPPDHPSARRPFAVVFASPEGRRVFLLARASS